MVQTYQSPVRIYKHPFELVMAAYEKRFPTCPQIPIFVGSTVVDEYNSPDGAEWMIERKCQLNIDVPYILKKIAGVDFVFFTQKNTLNRLNRTLVIEATNISFNSRISILETCNYYVHPENPDWTCFEQSAMLDVKSFFGFEATVEKIAVKQYATNLAKGKEILEFFIDELIKNDQTNFAVFTEADLKAVVVPEKVADEKPEDEAEQQHKNNEELSSKLMKAAITAEKRGSKSFEDAESKLEAEYIRRFLGQLSPLEESRLCELKYSLQSHHKGKLPNDAHLLRFLRARDFDVTKAKEMVHNSIIWRKQHNVDKLLQEWTSNSVVAQFFPGCWHQSDKTGRPVFLLRLGALDIKGLIRSCGVEDVVKLTLSICEEGLNRTASATASIGTPISSWTLLIDLEGLSMRHLWRPGIQALLKIIEIVEANYPETMGQVLVVRAPRVFPVLWTLISPLIHENTRNKIMINCGESCNDEIRKFIADQYIPDFLGGTCITNCNNGGHIPKALYKDTEEISEDSDILASNYSKAVINRSIPFEIVIPISTTGCVLTWDFDVLKNDCSFAVYHTDKILEKTKSPSSSPPHSPTSPTTGMMDGFLSNNHMKFEVACDPTLQKDVNLTIEEESVTFQEGDSMQGSHYCSKLGTYILQWKLNDQARDTHHYNHSTAIDFGLNNHKCRIMYYYEVLDSQNFRGSVASLESSRSSFSSIAPPSAPPTPKAK